MKVPFAEAGLASHFLRMCLYMWQDQFNLHKKGGTSVDMCSLILSLKAIERVCSQERSKISNASCNKKASHSKKKVTKRPGTDTTTRVPKKAPAEKHCDLCKKHRGTQLSKKLDKLEKVIKKKTPRSRSVAIVIVIPTRNRESGQVA